MVEKEGHEGYEKEVRGSHRDKERNKQYRRGKWVGEQEGGQQYRPCLKIEMYQQQIRKWAEQNSNRKAIKGDTE